ncbi:acyltransferase family protein [Methylomonas sp. 11b]|uniref:acyltransferase family protein n=1 Tax=Methylomonas sp. 11b TaxID=1168169 RepID=UPI0004B74C8A|nr:acyltransferase [Methylomonas sp. 11b]
MDNRYRKTIVSHHSLRGVAAVLVVFFHIREISYDKGAALDSVTSFFSMGYLWVDFFFILSGYILSYVYASLFLLDYKSNLIKSFYVARFSRVYPLHFFTLILYLFLEWSFYSNRPEVVGMPGVSFESLVASLLLIQGWSLSDLTLAPLNSPAWSISTEMACYLLFPFIIKWLRFNIFFVGMIVVSLSVALYLIYYGEKDGFVVIRCFAGFMLGIFIFIVYKEIPVTDYRVATSLQLIGGSGVLFAMHFSLSHSLVIASFGLLLYSTASDCGFLAKLLNTRIFVLLGTLSYSIYLNHWIIYKAYLFYGVYVFGALSSNYSPMNVSILKYFSLMFVIFVLSFITYRYIEIPAQKYLKRTLQ